MKRFFEGLVMAAVTAGFLCIAVGEAVAKNPERPYRARGQEMLVGSCELAGQVGELYEGSLIATHAGLSETSTCVIVTGAFPPLYKFVGRGVGTAANGDLLYFSVDGTTDVSEDPCVSEFTASFAGGTGRFDGASGQAQGESTRPWVEGMPFVCGPEQSTTLNGTIVY